MIYILDTNTYIFGMKNVGKFKEQINTHLADTITTSSEDAILVADNIRHFERVQELRLENWK